MKYVLTRVEHDPYSYRDYIDFIDVFDSEQEAIDYCGKEQYRLYPFDLYHHKGVDSGFNGYTIIIKE